MSNKFTKHCLKYGLLRRLAKPDKPWSFVNFASRIYDTKPEACECAIELNVCQADNKSGIHYIYKPVEVLLEVEIDEAIGDNS